MRTANSTAPFGYTLAAIAAAVLVALAYYSRDQRLALSDATFLTGWVLLGSMVSLGLFNIRKRLSALPLGRAAYWLALHVVVGLFAVGMFIVHTGGIWPTGMYEQILAGLFWATALSGLFGWLYQRAIPKRLTRVGYEVMYERVPAEIAALRETAEQAALDGVSSSGQPTLGRFYTETVDWYFQRPRFEWSHILGSGAALQWIDQRFGAVQRLIGGQEEDALNTIEAAARRKLSVDAHYALQRSLKLWVAVHVVLTAAVLSLAVWHLILVHVYAR
jgi:hypothetical protein